MKTAYNKGFTLLEVMISVTVIAIVFVSLFRMQTGSILLAEAGRFNTLAPILAGKILHTIEKDIKDWSDHEGNFGENYPGFAWTCEIADISLHELDFIKKESPYQLKKITLVVTGPSGETPFKAETWRVVFD